tara:strand:- start:1772 stop:2587 length:816 start_codon:yes stop_codon:yes gene_type:complete
MNKKKLTQLKKILSVPTYSWEEDLLINYVTAILEKRGYPYYVDDLGSIYVTKGKTKHFPCLVAHLDSVHEIQDYTVKEEYHPNAQNDKKLSLVAYSDNDNKRCGIGGDDKAGVFICLELLDRLDNVKVFFPVAEEIGCQGTRKADKKFFKDVGYAIQFDSTENNTMSKTLMGVKLYNDEGNFINKCSDIILEHGITKWLHHPYTDTMVLKEMFDFSCLNFAAGYYGWHSDHEYVVVEDVENAINLGEKLLGVLGEEKYRYKHDKSSWTLLG